MYLSPLSGNKTTTVFPSFSLRDATSIAAFKAAPEEIPAEMPSVLINSLPVANASSFSTGMISSITFLSKMLGTKPAPIPWILCGPATPVERTALVFGSTALP